MGISICFPHVDNPWNTDCLELKKKMLKENTNGEYQLFYMTGTRKEDVYPAWDWLFRRAKYDIILWDNSDITYAKNWDVLIHKYINQTDWLSLRVVECGQIGVAATNIAKNFGITANSFRRQEFEDWCVEDSKSRPEFEHGWSWYSPSAFRKEWYISTGGFDLSLPPFPNDIDRKWQDKIASQTKFDIVNSYAYHFQYQRENTGEKGPRI